MRKLGMVFAHEFHEPFVHAQNGNHLNLCVVK